MCYDRKKDRRAPCYAGAQVRFGDHVAAVCMRPATLREPWPVLNKPLLSGPAAGGYYEPDGGAYHVNREGYYWTSWEDIALTFDCSESYSPCLMLNYYAVLGFSVRLFCQLPAE